MKNSIHKLILATTLIGTPLLAASVELPLERTAYFIGETVPVTLTGTGPLKLEAVNTDGRVLLYQGVAGPLWLATANLAPGDYALELNGSNVLARVTLTSPLRKSAASMQDEVMPSEKLTSDQIAQTFKESGLTACVAVGDAEFGAKPVLDAMARTGALLLINPDTRPNSFLPVGNDLTEIAGMSQRMILGAQANGQYPNFGGFCFGWDTTGFAVHGRRMLLTYWGWGNQTEALRNYITRHDQFKQEEFTRRTGLQPVTEAEYIAYLLAVGQVNLAPAIDLTTKIWLEEIAQHMKPLTEADRLALEKRIDAWAGYLMGLYEENYAAYVKDIRAVDPAQRHTSSVQVDHAPIRHGQYFPSAYAPLDFQYQSTWNDQVGGPDYVFQSLFVTSMISMSHQNRPTWISNTHIMAHHRADMPGKFTRGAAHGLAYGGSGIGFALEGFSNLLGGMSGKQSAWENIQNNAGAADVLAGKDFLDRFAALAVTGHGDHGVGILWSRSQFNRQNLVMGFGTSAYMSLITLTRLGYTPRFVTEEELTAQAVTNVRALVVIGQTVALPEKVAAGLVAFQKQGGKIFVDGSTTTPIAGAEKIAATLPLSLPGKPHSWSAPNMIGGEHDTAMAAKWVHEFASAFLAALGDTGRAVLRSERGAESLVSLLQLTGGADAKYVVAVNESYIKTQADWHEVREQLTPAGSGWLYDCTDEKALGQAAPVTCDLSRTTARVFAMLPRELKDIRLAATQALAAGNELQVSVSFLDAAGKPLAAVLPFQLRVLRPDGQPLQEFYRATTMAGTFTMAVPIPANVPVGQWTVAVRSQLNGLVAELPVTVSVAKSKGFATAQTEPIIVRERAAIEALLTKGSTIVLPVFNEQLLPAAQRAKEVLARRGVTVEIWEKPATGTYTIGYDPAPDLLATNALVDGGKLFGRIKDTMLNGNGWYSKLSGWRFGRSVIVLDLPGANPIGDSLGKAKLLWPKAGAGRPVVQLVHWAFGPQKHALVIQATDAAGLLTAVEALAKLPADRLTPSIAAAKTALWQQYHIGGQPAQPTAGKLTAKGLTTRIAPVPFRIDFAKGKPVAADAVKRPVPTPRVAKALPVVVTPKEYILYYRFDGKWQETATAEFLNSDLRFSEGVLVVADVTKPGKTKISVEGVFRYSDRKPCWQAQWEDIIDLREKVLPKTRRPMEFEVQVNGKTAGNLTPSKTEEKEVPLELRAPSAGTKPKSVVEEVVTQLTGEIELPAGRQEIFLIHRNVVDGKLLEVRVGALPVGE